MYEDIPNPSHPNNIKKILFLKIRIIIDMTNIIINIKNCFCSCFLI